MTAKKIHPAALLSLCFFIIIFCGGAAENSPAAALTSINNDKVFFPFSMPWDGPVENSAVDVSFLNDKPAGKNGRIVVKDGGFVESGTGKRIRFMGINLCGGDILPADPARYDGIMRRLASAGFNLIRIHHFDNMWAINEHGSLWRRAADGRAEIDPAQQDKLFQLVAAAKKYGIFVNFNLKVSRRLGAADGMPPEIEKIKTNHQKALDFFHPLWLEKQREYARDILTAKNPHTGLSLIDDPAVAFLEINNENSIQGASWETAWALDSLPDVFKTELARQWTDYLRGKYADDAALKIAWRQAAATPGADLIAPATPWRAGANSGAEMTTAPLGAGEISAAKLKDQLGAVATKFDLKKITDKAHHAQADIIGLTLKENALYTLSFKIRADSGRWASVSLRRDRDPWDFFGLSQDFGFDKNWSEQKFVFTATAHPAGQARISFTLGQKVGTVEIAELRLREGADGAGLRAGESLAAGKIIAIPTAARTPEQTRDWEDFLAYADTKYAVEMKNFLREELGAKALLACGQIDFTGLYGLEREESFDYADSHGYWGHPNFQGGWNAKNWTTTNKSQLDDLRRGVGTLGRLARYRVAGRPFSVSEYDHSAPNDYASEMYPLLMLVAARQDWDALYTFCHGPAVKDADASRINQWFDQTGHPGKIGFAPAAAVMWRSGAFQPAPQSITLALPRPYHRFAHLLHVAWQRENPDDAKFDMLTTRLGISYDQVDAPTLKKSVLAPAKDGADLTRFNHDGRMLSGSAPTTVAVAGFFGADANELGAIDLRIKPPATHVSAILVALDNQPLGASRKMLFTIMGRAENSGMKWNEHRDSVSDQWGAAPTLVEGIGGRFALRTDHADLKVYALDASGKRAAPVEVQYDASPANRPVAAGEKTYALSLSFDLSPQYKTIWYEIATE